VVDRFGTKPYGWPSVATLCIAAGLSAKAKLEARADSTVLEGEELAKALRNSHVLGNVLLTPQTEYTSAQLRKAKDLYRELFGTPAGGTDARSHGAEWAAAARDLGRDLDSLVALQAQYTFTQALVPLRDRITAMLDKQPGWYITEPVKQEDDLLNGKEDILDKIKSFMAGNQKVIYDEARGFLATQDANLTYIDPTASDQIRGVLDDPACFKGPSIQALKADLLFLKEKVDLQVLSERKAVQTAIADARDKVLQTAEFQALSPEDQAKIQSQFDAHATGLDQVSGIAVLRDRANGISRGLVPQMLAEIATLARPVAPVGNDDGDGRAVGDTSKPPIPAPVAYVNASDIKNGYSQPYIADENDLDRYLEELKKTLLVELRAGKKVIV